MYKVQQIRGEQLHRYSKQDNSKELAGKIYTTLSKQFLYKRSCCKHYVHYNSIRCKSN